MNQYFEITYNIVEKGCSFTVLFQSEPSYVPLKLQESQEKSSDAESDDSSVKSVRFSKLTEVLINVLCVAVTE